ncbi:MAG: hypothetical protein ABH878_05620 [bacterium]
MRRIVVWMVIGVGILFYGCSLKKPAAPRWEVEFTIPIAQKIYSLTDIITDSSQVDSTGNWVSSSGDTLFLNFADSLERTEVGNALQFDAISKAVETELGVRTVNAPGSRTADFQIAELEPFYGQVVPVNPFSFSPAPQILNAFEEYDWAYPAWGEVELTITNHLPVPLENLNLRIYNLDPYTLLLSALIAGPLDSNASLIEIHSLPIGPRLDNQLVVHLNGESPGSTQQVAISEDDHVEVLVTIGSLGVASAVAQIPTQSFSEDTTFIIEENDTLRLGEIKLGTLSYSFTNNTELINTIVFTLPELYGNDAPFTDSFVLSPQETYRVDNHSLMGFELRRPQQDNKMQARVTAEALDSNDPAYGSSGGWVFVEESQDITAKIEVSPLVFSYAEGFLDSTVITVNPQAVVLEDLPGDLQELQVESAYGSFYLVNTIMAPVDIVIALDAYKAGTAAVHLDLPTLHLPPGTESQPGILDTTIAGFEGIINVLPDSIRTTSEAVIYGETSAADDNWVEGNFVIYTPFSLSLSESTLDPEITTLEEGFNNPINSIDLNLTLVNHIPLSGELLVLACWDSIEFNNPYNTVVDTMMQTPLPQAIIGWDGFVVSPGTSTTIQNLNSAQIARFADATVQQPLYIETLIRINSTDGDTVQVKPDDYISVEANAHILLDIDFEDNGDGGN